MFWFLLLYDGIVDAIILSSLVGCYHVAAHLLFFAASLRERRNPQMLRRTIFDIQRRLSGPLGNDRGYLLASRVWDEAEAISEQEG